MAPMPGQRPCAFWCACGASTVARNAADEEVAPVLSAWIEESVDVAGDAVHAALSVWPRRHILAIARRDHRVDRWLTRRAPDDSRCA